MKKSLVSIALFALMAAGVAQADNVSSIQPQDLFRFNLSCTFGAVCTAESRILLDIRKDQDSTEAVQPEWFGNLLSVSCPSAGGLISASDATLYRLTGAGNYRWQIDNSDATVHIFLQDHPFDGTDHTGTGVIAARLKVGNQGGVDGICAVFATDVPPRN